MVALGKKPSTGQATRTVQHAATIQLLTHNHHQQLGIQAPTLILMLNAAQVVLISTNSQKLFLAAK